MSTKHKVKRVCDPECQAPRPPETHYKRPELKEGQSWKDKLFFCTRCFACSDGGSWGGGVHQEFCENCCSSGANPSLTRGEIDDIRQSAAWVGKRYYKDDESIKEYEELRLLRSKMPLNPHDRITHRQAERQPDGTVFEASWNCERFYDGNLKTSTSIGFQKAPTREEAAIEFNKMMRYTEFVPDAPKKEELVLSVEHQASIFLQHAANLIAKLEGKQQLADQIGEACMMLRPKPHKLNLIDTCYGMTGGDLWICEGCNSRVVTLAGQLPGGMMCPAIREAL